MSLRAIRDSFHTQFLQIRSTHRLIFSDDFSIAFNTATILERTQIKQAIKRFDKDAVRKFIDINLLKLTPFHNMSIRQLRRIGQNVRIVEYLKKDKETLIEEICDAVKRLKKGGQRVSFQSQEAE